MVQLPVWWQHANNIPMFQILQHGPQRSAKRCICCSAAFTFGDHLATAGVAKNDIPMIVVKLVAGVTAIIVASLFAPKSADHKTKIAA